MCLVKSGVLNNCAVNLFAANLLFDLAHEYRGYAPTQLLLDSYSACVCVISSGNSIALSKLVVHPSGKGLAYLSVSTGSASP
jgi:hypothetical protein